MKKKENSGLPRSRPQQQTWAVRGIEPETRTAATKAARRAGLTVGQWCNRALRDAATGELKEPLVPAPRLEETLAKLAETIERQNARLDAMEQTDRKPEEALPDRATFRARLWWLFRGS